jgi:hypothetical protein
MEIFEVTKRLLALYLAKPREFAEAVLETDELFICGDIHCVTNSFCKNVLKIVTP